MKLRITNYELRIALCLLLGLFVLALAAPALAQSSDEYYNKAVNKYFLGDNAGAISDLNESLRLDPNNAQAKELMKEIRQESGTPTTLAPTPAPIVQQPTPKPAQPKRTPPAKRKIKNQRAVKAVKAVRAVPPPPDIRYFTPIKTPSLGLTGWDFAWIATALLTLLYVVIRYLFAYVQLQIERHSVQICTECKYANSGQAEFCIKCGARLKPWVGVTAAQRKWFTKLHWQKNPFTLDIMPKLFTGYQTQVNTIFDKVYSRTGHILVMGNKGVGKTTLLKWLAETLAKEFHTVYIPRPTEDFNDLLQYLAEALKIKKPRGEKITIYDMEAMVSKTNRNILLLLDEAHEFSQEFERPLRTLGDLNGVNFILAGLMEAREKIKRDCPPFFDRIIEEVILHHLTLDETSELIRKRIESVGGTGIAPFTPEAVENIFKMSGGVPRTILKVCDWVIAEAIHNNLETVQGIETANFPQEGSEKQ